MGFGDRLRKGFSMLFNPSKDAKGNYSVGKSLKFYYSVAILSAIFAAVVFSIAHFAGAPPSAIPLAMAFGTAAPFYLGLVFIAVLMFVFVPIGMFIDSAIYHLVGRFFLKTFKHTYEKTFAGVAGALTPVSLLIWLLFIPVAGMGFAVLIGIWEFVLLVITLSVQQRTNRLVSAVTLLVAIALVAAIAWSLLGIGVLAVYTGTTHLLTGAVPVTIGSI